MSEEKVYTFNEYVLGYDSGGDNDRSCLTISKILNDNMYVMSSLYDESAEVISTILDSLQQKVEQLENENFNIRENIHLERISLPPELTKDKNFMELYDIPSYEDLKNKVEQLEKENDKLKHKLNDIAFGDDSELALRFLRKIGYVDFDEKRKVYINKHNNEPFTWKDEREKDYYLKDEELNEYTQQLEYKVERLEKENKELNRMCELYGQSLYNADLTKAEKRIEQLENIRKEAIESLEKALNNPLTYERAAMNKLLNILNKRK